MLGCVGTAPDNKAAIPSSFPDNFGGNMDYNGMGAGATVMLPVFEPGALFFLGDGHARQGDGEVVGSAIETSLDVEFSVDLINGKKSTGLASKIRTTSWCLAVRAPSTKRCSMRPRS